MDYSTDAQACDLLHAFITRAEFQYLCDGCNVKVACAFPVLVACPLPECNHLLCRAAMFGLTAAQLLLCRCRI